MPRAWFNLFDLEGENKINGFSRLIVRRGGVEGNGEGGVEVIMLEASLAY